MQLLQSIMMPRSPVPIHLSNHNVCLLAFIRGQGWMQGACVQALCRCEELKLVAPELSCDCQEPRVTSLWRPPLRPFSGVFSSIEAAPESEICELLLAQDSAGRLRAFSSGFPLLIEADVGDERLQVTSSCQPRAFDLHARTSLKLEEPLGSCAIDKEWSSSRSPELLRCC